MSTVTAVKAETFEHEVLKSKIPVVVDFWAGWCGPCKAIAPVVKKLAEVYAGKIRFVKVDIDEESRLAQKFRVSSIPTLMFFSQGKKVGTVVGAINLKEMNAEIKKHFDVTSL